MYTDPLLSKMSHATYTHIVRTLSSSWWYYVWNMKKSSSSSLMMAVLAEQIHALLLLPFLNYMYAT